MKLGNRWPLRLDGQVGSQSREGFSAAIREPLVGGLPPCGVSRRSTDSSVGANQARFPREK